jgi:redox-sensitive bicupin YhaK (pirin superfamily)
MIRVRKADERGREQFGWLDSRHTFSFGQYYDSDHMGFGHLRVINDDRVVPGGGFDTHGHRDMEIISVVLEGAMEHRDSLGHGSVIRPGDVQRMTAGTGITHSEFNHSKEEPLRFLQIWIVPSQKGLEPGYEQKHFGDDERRGRLRLVGSRDGHDGSVVIHQDVSLFTTTLSAGDAVSHDIPAGGHAWLQVASGDVDLNGVTLGEGDGAAIDKELSITVTSVSDAELLLFELT